MVVRKVAESRVVLADNCQRPLDAGLINREPGLDGVTHECRNGSARGRSSLLQAGDLLIFELQLHASHMHHGSIIVNPAADIRS